MPIIEGHHDFAVLERRLAALIREGQEEGGGPLSAPVAIVAPTLRLLSYLRVRLAELAPGLVNVHFFHHQSLAAAALVAVGRPVAAALSDDVRTAIVGRLVETRGGALSEYVRARPGCAASIRETLDDLREACVPPGDAVRVVGLTNRGAEILQLYAAYVRALDASTTGPGDRARLLMQAAPAVREYTRRFRLVVHYGAYDLIGVNLELMRSIDTRLVFLAPHHAASRAYDHARRFWPAMLSTRPTVLPDADGDRLLSDRLPQLYDEGVEPGPLEAGRRARVTFFHAQGATAELREAALRILALQRDSTVPLHRIGVVARSLEPYAAALRPVFEDLGLPFNTTASFPALREARVQAALQLARALLRDFPRQPLMDLCRGGLLGMRGRDPAGEAHAWDRLSRDWHITGGHATWTRDLAGWVAAWEPYLPPDANDERKERARARKSARARQAEALASLVERLQRAGRPLRRAATWTGWAGALRSLLEELVDGFATPEPDGDAGAEAVLRVLSEMPLLDPAGMAFTASAALSFFEASLCRALVPLGAVGGSGPTGGTDNGGVRVLDAMQARGIAFDALFLIGFNADLFPRHAIEDPFLPDGDRRLLRDALRVPLPLKSTALEEERLLLAHLLGSARCHLTVSWQRADESGRAKVPSLALREVARLVDGAPDLARIEAGAWRVLAHPAEAGVDALVRFGMLPPRDACVQAALQARSPRALTEALPRRILPAPAETLETLRPGLAMLAAIDEFPPADLRYDAFVGAAAPRPEHFSPSRLEILGACPQHYFFRHVLVVEELEEVREAYEFDAREIGARIHDILHDAFRGLVRPDGSLPTGEARDLARRAFDLARAAWERHTHDIRARTLPRYPLLWQTIEGLWLHALQSFLVLDLEALVRDKVRVIGLERQETASIDLGAGRGKIEVRGRFDRLAAGSEGVVVADYKTSGDIERHVSPAHILKGTSLQLPLYLMLLEALARAQKLEAPPARAEILGVGPRFMSGPDDAAAARVGLDMSTLVRHRDGLLETIGVLLDLTTTGSFPLNADSWLCTSCPYVRACRRGHVPTVARVVSAAGGRDYALLRRKNGRKPLLDQVRRPDGSGADA